MEKVHNIQIMEPVFRSRFAHSCSLFRLIFDPILDQLTIGINLIPFLYHFGSNLWKILLYFKMNFWINFGSVNCLDQFGINLDQMFG